MGGVPSLGQSATATWGLPEKLYFCSIYLQKSIDANNTPFSKAGIR